MNRKRMNPVEPLDISPQERERLIARVNRAFGGQGKEIRSSAKLYADFTGHEEISLEKVRVPNWPKAVAVLGYCDAIEYTTVRDGETEKYRHTFKKDCRPLYCVSSDGKQLFLLGGAFTVGERGIVDDA